VECMRNTPLNGGIRATGAVRQQNPSLQDRDSYEDGTYTLLLQTPLAASLLYCISLAVSFVE
jgi:hypothetical protein